MHILIYYCCYFRPEHNISPELLYTQLVAQLNGVRYFLACRHVAEFQPRAIEAPRYFLCLPTRVGISPSSTRKNLSALTTPPSLPGHTARPSRITRLRPSKHRAPFTLHVSPAAPPPRDHPHLPPAPPPTTRNQTDPDQPRAYLLILTPQPSIPNARFPPLLRPPSSSR